ncbi:efflux RND transporter periplasmic adaptor subunit [Patescibacteria group bacterium]
MEKIQVILKKIFANRKRVIIIGLVFLATLFFLWRSRNLKKAEPEIQTVPVEKGMIISSVSASGQVLSVNLMSANTMSSGIVKKVYVQDGDLVKKGDKILEIELDPQGSQKYAAAWSSYLSAKNSLASAQASQHSLQATMFGKWDTFKELAESDEYDEDHIPNRNLPEYHIPEKEWLAAEANYKKQTAVIVQSQAALSSAWQSYQLASPVIVAPADGEVTSLMFAEGMSIGSLDTGNSTSNQKIATIKTEGLPVIFVNLSEIDVSRVSLAQKATVILDSLPEKTFTGEVIGVDRIGQTSSGVTQYPANIRLDSASGEILPNMTLSARIIINRKDQVLLVPSGAIQTQGDQSLVIVFQNGKEQFVPVEIGLTSDTQVEITSGLGEGDLVVVSNGFIPNSGQGGSSPFSSSGMRMMRMVH